MSDAYAWAYDEDDLPGECWEYDGQDLVVVVTGMPSDAVQIGIGRTRAEARANLESTPIQSCGRDGGHAAAIEWAQLAGWIGRLDSQRR